MIHRRKHNTTRHGMTLIELLMALTITALIGVTVTMVMTAASASVKGQEAMQSAVVRGATVSGRLDSEIRGAAAILYWDNHTLVLWQDSADRGDAPKTSEMIRIEYDANRGVLKVRRPSSLLTGLLDVTYEITGVDFNRVTSLLTELLFPSETWAENVSDFSILANSDDPQQARSISYRYTVSVDGTGEPIIGAASLRNAP